MCAVVVTHNREETLPRCLDALLRQNRPPDGLLVVVNGCTDGTVGLLERSYPNGHRLILRENLGGGGGFEAGLREAIGKGYEWVWLMDDDPVAEPPALERLMAQAARTPEGTPAAFASVQYDAPLDKYNAGFLWRRMPVGVPRTLVDHGEPFPVDLAPFCGFLVNREAVQRVGYPRGDFFMRFTDYEYSLRLVAANVPLISVPRSRMLHYLGERNAAGHVVSKNPPWKAYYDARNRVFTAVRLRRQGLEFFFTLRYLLRQSARDIVLDPAYGVPNTWMRVRGVVDGLTGRMGKRVDPARSRAPDRVKVSKKEVRSANDRERS